ncbi:ubiquinol-cytochrome c reductase iron-sulfur subunit [Mycobacterium sp. 1274761.0]|uniref:QcrA and Rieske domain-containing protein n=1 Tax=Mycobacterium sp. 1274761.0 TaxID=1834077 RepID=UPI0007FFB96E|nr:Rieske (2Fe-2S) protein [Mycobacterium sp. 1274761.0]OBK77667.1 (2Fe-2S)-binding protein [Mycobacterium sp. 1274761.0]
MLFDDVQVPRQQVIRGAGLVLTAGALAACGNDKGEQAPAASSEPSPTSASAPDGAIAKKSEVPVGSGVIVDDVVVTQPAAGEFKAFSTTCTHKGCAVNTVADGTINCPCHGSKFNLDGTVANGPATLPLKAKNISVEGDSIVLV